MDNINNHYKKKMELCKKLGAKKFQKIVFKIEEMKWKFVKKFIPNYLKYADKYIEHLKKKELKKAKNDREVAVIKDSYTLRKMLIRKEFNNSENLNYHINQNSPSKFIEQLKWNKEIHKKGMIFDLIAIPTLVIGAGLGSTFLIPVALYETFSLFINFQCVNVQNYNIYRIKNIEEKLKQKENNRINKAIDNYHEAFEVVGKTIEKKEDIPTINEIVNNIKTVEQAEQLRNFLLQMTKERETIKGGKIK